MSEAASKIKGLQQSTGLGHKTKTIFLGWDRVAVDTAAKRHPAKEAKEFQAEENEREDERTEITEPLDTFKSKKGTRIYSPVGSYVVECKQIQEECGDDQADEMTLDIRQSKEPNVFEASFNIGYLEGVMIISAEKDDCEEYCLELGREAERKKRRMGWTSGTRKKTRTERKVTMQATESSPQVPRGKWRLFETRARNQRNPRLKPKVPSHAYIY